LANDVVSEISAIYKSFYKINSINFNRYNKWITVYYLLNLLLLLNGLLSLLFTTLSRSLQFNFSVLKLFSKSDPSGLNWGSTNINLPGVARNSRIKRASVGRRGGKNLYLLT
jgi:hypothetical protein